MKWSNNGKLFLVVLQSSAIGSSWNNTAAEWMWLAVRVRRVLRQTTDHDFSSWNEPTTVKGSCWIEATEVNCSWLCCNRLRLAALGIMRQQNDCDRLLLECWFWWSMQGHVSRWLPSACCYVPSLAACSTCLSTSQACYYIAIRYVYIMIYSI